MFVVLQRQDLPENFNTFLLVSPRKALSFNLDRKFLVRPSLQDTTHLLQRPCYQRGSPCQDPAGNWTKRKPDHRKETQTAVVRTCLPFIGSGQNHLARHSEKGEEGKAVRGRGGKTTSGNEQAWSLQSPRRQWRTGENGGNWLQNHLWCPNDPGG